MSLLTLIVGLALTMPTAATAQTAHAAGSAGSVIARSTPQDTPQIEFGIHVSCGVQATKLACWGDDSYDVIKVPRGAYTSVSIYDSYACAIRTNSHVKCWGSDYGQPHGAFTQISVGDFHGCGIRANGAGRCWGANKNGEGTPVEHAVSVSAGQSATCWLFDTRKAACYGYNIGGSLTPPAGFFTALDYDGDHACGLRTDGRVLCWGTSFDDYPDPPAGTFVSVGAGFGHTCGLRPSGEVACWGIDGDPGLDPPAGTFESVTTGYVGSCAFRTDGTRTCWGFEQTGALEPIVTANPPSARVGVPYSAAIPVSATDPTLRRWRVESGKLPPGLHLNATSGVVSGTPTGAGTYVVHVAADLPAIGFAGVVTLTVSAAG